MYERFGRSPRSGAMLAGIADSGVYLAAVVIGRGAQLLAIPALTRWLSPADFAIFDLMLVFITLLSAALLLGTDSGVAAEYAKCDAHDHQTLHGIFAASCAVPMALGFIVAALLGCVQLLGLVDGSSAYAMWICLACALMLSLNNCLIGLMRWTARARLAALLIAMVGAVPVLGAVSIFVLGGPARLLSLQTGLLSGYAVATVLCFLLCGKSFRLAGATASATRIRALLKQSWPMGVASLALPGRRSAERFVVLALLGEQALATYALLARIAQVLEIALQALGNGLYPRALRALDEAEGRRLAVQTLQLFWIASFGGLLLSVLASTPLVAWVGGAAYTASAHLLPASIAMACLAALPYCAGMAFFHTRRIGLYATVLMLTAVVAVLAASVGVFASASLSAWLVGGLAGSSVLSVWFIGLSEKAHPVGYSVRRMTIALLTLGSIGTICALSGGL